MKYTTVYSDAAFDDLKELFEVIAYDYYAPENAEKYLRGLLETINLLERNAAIYAVQTDSFYRQFGPNVRRVNYKKMAVIYTVYENIAHIHRIVTASLISG
jgi:plasmid stabilization system protein ParE